MDMHRYVYLQHKQILETRESINQKQYNMNIRKSLLTSVLVLSTLSLFAQEKEDSKEAFVPHWFMQIQGGAAHTIGEAKFSKLISPAAALNFGYHFNPLFGLRFGASGRSCAK